jgi:hypothetical protein
MQSTNDVNISEEIQKMEWEPLSAIEKKLISGSLILGSVLLLVLYYISSAFFPGVHS